MSDNFKIEVASDQKQHLEVALEMAISKNSTVKAYTKDAKRMVLFWHKDGDKSVELPMPMGPKMVLEFVLHWLNNEAAYGHEPDHDGDNKRGFRVYNGPWNRVDNLTYSIVAIEPEWMMYGK